MDSVDPDQAKPGPDYENIYILYFFVTVKTWWGSDQDISSDVVNIFIRNRINPKKWDQEEENINLEQV